MSSFEGSRIPDPGFPGDDGTAAPEVTAVLAAYDAGEVDYVAALAVLQRSRLLVPVVALLGEVEVDTTPEGAGLAHEKSSDIAAVLMTRPDGRRGLLAFTGQESLAVWNAEARPVPVVAQLVAQAALQEGADALLVDLAGPVRFPIEGADLQALAAGWQLTRVGERSAWIRPGPE